VKPFTQAVFGLFKPLALSRVEAFAGAAAGVVVSQPRCRTIAMINWF